MKITAVTTKRKLWLLLLAALHNVVLQQNEVLLKVRMGEPMSASVTLKSRNLSSSSEGQNLLHFLYTHCPSFLSQTSVECFPMRPQSARRVALVTSLIQYVLPKGQIILPLFACDSSAEVAKHWINLLLELLPPVADTSKSTITIAFIVNTDEVSKNCYYVVSGDNLMQGVLTKHCWQKCGCLSTRNQAKVVRVVLVR